MISVLVVDHLRILRDAIAHFLHERDEIAVEGTVAHAALATAMVQDLEPDVVLVGMQTPGSAELVQRLVASGNNTRIVALGECSEPAVSALVDATLADVIAAIHGVIRSTVVKPEPRELASVEVTEVPGLTHREHEVMRLVDKGFSNKEIARELNMAVSTVKNHVHHILGKLDVKRRGQAAAAVRAGPRKLGRARNHPTMNPPI